MQRAFAVITTIVAGSSTTLVVTVSARYSDSNDPGNPHGEGVSPSVPFDASPREIINAVVAGVIAQQPIGYDLAEKDIIITSLERG